MMCFGGRRKQLVYRLGQTAAIRLNMELETINKLYLELAQVATATTQREAVLETALRDANELCRSMNAIVEREGKDVNWDAFRNQLGMQLELQHILLAK